LTLRIDSLVHCGVCLIGFPQLSEDYRVNLMAFGRAALVAGVLVSKMAVATPVTISAGESVVFNFDFVAQSISPPPPYDLVVVEPQITQYNSAVDSGAMNFYAGLNGTGSAYGGCLDMSLGGTLCQGIWAGWDDGVFSVRITVTTGSVVVDPLAFAHGAGLTPYVFPTIGVTLPPALVSAVSRKVHGAAGTFDLPLPLVPTNPATEPRIGPAQTLVFTFDKPIASAIATVTEGNATAEAPVFSGSDVVVGLTSVADQQYVTISLTNVASTDGGTGGSGSVRVGFLKGDVNQSRVVSLADLGLVNSQLAQSVTAANYLKDVNANGTLTLGDKGITNVNLSQALPAP
jgi:hypothetical protein